MPIESPEQEPVTTVEPEPAKAEATSSQLAIIETEPAVHCIHVAIPDYRLHCTVPHRGRRG